MQVSKFNLGPHALIRGGNDDGRESGGGGQIFRSNPIWKASNNTIKLSKLSRANVRDVKVAKN